MKKCIILLLGMACLPSWSLDWKLPVVTMKYEIAQGECEDPEDETLEPTSVRNTATLRIRQDADPATFWLTLRTSAKDYFQEAGDYSYLEAEHEGAWRADEMWKLGYLLGIKRIGYAQPDSDGLFNDNLCMKAGGTAVLTFLKGTSLEAGLSSRYTWATNLADAQQGYALTAGFASRLGEWLLGIHYRGEYRLPMGSSSSVATRTYNTGSVSFQWDPNR
ncbi:MAG: hypothetical protein ABSG63_04885 [Spirochaetia bacterium]|jgi:hypothetical protein